MGTAQMGDVFIKDMSGNGNTALRAIRIIMPIGTKWMIKFDAVAVSDKKIAEVWGLMFYSRGNKEMEKRALEGELA